MHACRRPMFMLIKQHLILTFPHTLVLDFFVLIVLILDIFFKQKFFIHTAPCFPVQIHSSEL